MKKTRHRCDIVITKEVISFARKRTALSYYS